MNTNYIEGKLVRMLSINTKSSIAGKELGFEKSCRSGITSVLWKSSTKEKSEYCSFEGLPGEEIFIEIPAGFESPLWGIYLLALHSIDLSNANLGLRMVLMGFRIIYFNYKYIAAVTLSAKLQVYGTNQQKFSYSSILTKYKKTPVQPHRGFI